MVNAKFKRKLAHLDNVYFIHVLFWYTKNTKFTVYGMQTSD
jgi:hypothetical protein